MGMLLTMAVILAAASIWVEVKLVNGVPTIKRLNRDGLHVNKKWLPFTINLDGAVVGIGMSIILSLALGSVFGAAGLVVMVAGLLSTAVTEPYWGIKRTMEKRGPRTNKVQKVAQTLREVNSYTLRPAKRMVSNGSGRATKPVVFMHHFLREMAERKEQEYIDRMNQQNKNVG